MKNVSCKNKVKTALRQTQFIVHAQYKDDIFKPLPLGVLLDKIEILWIDVNCINPACLSNFPCKLKRKISAS